MKLILISFIEEIQIFHNKNKTLDSIIFKNRKLTRDTLTSKFLFLRKISYRFDGPGDEEVFEEPKQNSRFDQFKLSS